MKYKNAVIGTIYTNLLGNKYLKLAEYEYKLGHPSINLATLTHKKLETKLPYHLEESLTKVYEILKDLNVDYATVHLLNGLDALKAANEAAKKINLNLLGVSVLTSFNDDDLENLGFKNKVDKQVKSLIKIAMDANLYGVICSPLEIKMIKEIAPNLKCFTPGIRMKNAKDDQKRTMNANEAIKAGSDCLIIGRPITKGDPKQNIKNILLSIE